MSLSERAQFKGTPLTLFSPLLLVQPVVLGAAGSEQASITFSPRASHALIFSFCLSMAAQQPGLQLRGGKTPHSSMHSDCSPLHGYRRLCPAIRSASAQLTVHWLSEEKNKASIGCCSVAVCCNWSSLTTTAAWRLGPCKHSGCFIHWSVFTGSPVLPMCAD